MWMIKIVNKGKEYVDLTLHLINFDFEELD